MSPVLFNVRCCTDPASAVAASVGALSYAVTPTVEHLGWERRGVALSCGSIEVYRVGRFETRIVGHTSIGGRSVPISTPGRPLAYAAAAPRWAATWRGTDLLPVGGGWVFRPLAQSNGGALPLPGLLHGGGWALGLWPLVVLTAVLPAVRAVGWHRRVATRRAARGLCPACGYDLRGAPGGCPECGHGRVPVAGRG